MNSEQNSYRRNMYRTSMESGPWSLISLCLIVIIIIAISIATRRGELNFERNALGIKPWWQTGRII